MVKRTVKGATTVRWKTKDGDSGADAVYYEMKVMKGGSVIASIPCDSTGKPKKVENVSAYIYRVVGRNKTLISDFYFKVDGLSDTGAVNEVLVSQTSAASSCSFGCNTLATRSYRIRVTEGAQGTGNIVSEIVIPKNLDGVTGSSGYTYRPRGLFASGNNYVYNDEYRDVIIYKFSGVAHVFRVKKKDSTVKVAPTSVSGDSNWEAANELNFVATDFVLARQIHAEEIDGKNLRVENGYFSGDIYSPPTVITDSNLSLYTEQIGTTYYIDTEKSGLNILIECNPTSTFVFSIKRKTKLNGAEINLMSCNKSSKIYGALFEEWSDTTGIVYGSSKILVPMKWYKFRAVVFDKPDTWNPPALMNTEVSGKYLMIAQM